MLERIEITTKQGSTLVLPIGDSTEGYFVKDITGLDPVKATLVSSSVASIDGAQYQSSRRETRNLVFKIGVEISQRYGSVSALRKRLSSFLMPKSEAHFRFFSDDMPPVDISARVETFEFPLFTQEPEAICSLIAYDPDFIEAESTTFTGAATSVPTEFGLNYEGSVETGFKFRLNVTRNISEFKITHRSSDDFVGSFEYADTLLAGDVVEISTVSGNKYVTLTRNGSEQPKLYAMSPYSNWINVFPGLNYLGLVIEGGGMPYTIEYNNRYGGL